MSGAKAVTETKICRVTDKVVEREGMAKGLLIY